MADDPRRYTVTINIAAPGTPLLGNDGKPNGETSLPGHMWFSLSDGADGNPDRSYGFAPIESGSITGRGQISADDQHYAESYYQRTIEITKEQYDKLYEFAETARTGNEKYMSLNYNGLNNSCVDFVYKGLSHAGLHAGLDIWKDSARDMFNKRANDFEGHMKPVNNVDSIRSIPAPFPDSELNREVQGKMPSRNFKQWLLTEHNIDDNVKGMYAKLESDLGTQINEKGAGKWRNAMLAETTYACIERGINADKIAHMGINEDKNSFYVIADNKRDFVSVDAIAAAKVNPEERLLEANQLYLQMGQQLEQKDLDRQRQIAQQQEHNSGMKIT
ncbi:hypothetical protein [Neisseria sp. Ec49-e6-T10]|uniref:hypothetical protein n=1 Tax=Neisseria sp. Ec49-e6-T10 TaxID=3140744 RepID=UPI003EB888CD